MTRGLDERVNEERGCAGREGDGAAVGGAEAVFGDHARPWTPLGWHQGPPRA
jgi:hypothetical protein